MRFAGGLAQRAVTATLPPLHGSQGARLQHGHRGGVGAQTKWFYHPKIPRGVGALKAGVVISPLAGISAPPASSRARGCTTRRPRPVMDQL